MTTAVLLDHVRTYADAVRSHLSDLSPEQVEELTGGLEADLAEALEDPHGVAVTGGSATDRVPPAESSSTDRPPADGVVGSDPSGDGRGASLIDLTRRFGPAQDYAAELRAAAGLDPVLPTARRRSLRARWATRRDAARGRFLSHRERVTSSRHWPALESFGTAIRPAWWVLRGWLWFVILSWATQGLFFPGSVLVPESPVRWMVLAACVVLSVQWARGLVPDRRWSRRVLRTAHVVAAVIAVPMVLTATSQVTEPRTVYIDNTVQGAAPPEDGVYVDGQMVSNLFVYDADGNPLSGVQIFDDRGRQVRTTHDEGNGEWNLPGVDEPWSFAPSVDDFGRQRWNVYPLSGAPWDEWTYDEQGVRVPVEGHELRVPPHPFAKAPAVVVPDTEEPGGPEEGTDDVAPEGSVPDDAATQNAGTGDAATGELPDDAVPDAAVPDDAVPNDTVTGDAVTGEQPADVLPEATPDKASDAGADAAPTATSAAAGGA